MYHIESFLSARLFLVPQLVGDRIYFISNLSGHLSLYGMYYGGSVPEPLLPPDIALHNPHLLEGEAFHVFPKLGKVLVMIDHDGDEKYQPMLIPLQGGYPEPAFGDAFTSSRVHLTDCDDELNLVYFVAESMDKPLITTYEGDLSVRKVKELAVSEYGAGVAEVDKDHNRWILLEEYTMGDSVLFMRENDQQHSLLGKPKSERDPGEVVTPSGINSVALERSGKGLLVSSALFDDRYSLGWMLLDGHHKLDPVKIEGIRHSGIGELEMVKHLKGNQFLLRYNIDGCSWLYQASFNESKRAVTIQHVLVGEDDLSNGVLEHVAYDRQGDRFVLSFSTATSPSQIYTLEGKDRDQLVLHTNEKILGIPDDLLAPGEDASFTSFDGTRISARLYRPAPGLGFKGPRPLVYYIHGGPQGQERPDFAWFSMPIIEYLTLRGFSVFVPNVRGSTGYGLDYARQVDRDWGGQDRLDHVQAMTKVLPHDKGLDVKRAAVVGRSYGGYMTLMQAARHPDLWAAACDMFGPYDMLTFFEHIPETWKPNFRIAVGDDTTEAGRKLLVERSPRTYLDNLACPMLVIQGRNDPRVVASESETLVKDLRKMGKTIDLLLFEDEGHDVLKYENRVTCYNAITDFFVKYLKP